LLLKVCKLVHKFWDRVWGQRDQKWNFGVKIREFPRGNNQEQGDLFWCSELHRTDTHVPRCSGHLGSIRAVPNWFFWRS